MMCCSTGTSQGNFLLVYFTNQMRGIDLGHPVGLLNRTDFVTAGGEELAVLAESVIRQAERECQGPG